MRREPLRYPQGELVVVIERRSSCSRFRRSSRARTGFISICAPARDLACDNTISNSHGYPDGVPSADANISGLVTTSGYVGDQGKSYNP
jgi:hypothetical protein